MSWRPPTMNENDRTHLTPLPPLHRVERGPGGLR